ncbi:hypothetical protein AcV5_002422 [Taiwanofungus camphoratus]|nr:hypothetical protein AcV5_002422 [Antrodia cinnamomea]
MSSTSVPASRSVFRIAPSGRRTIFIWFTHRATSRDASNARWSDPGLTQVTPPRINDALLYNCRMLWNRDISALTLWSVYCRGDPLPPSASHILGEQKIA